ncbi:MAG: transcriptional [Geobacteraceae bacterium]|nr:MAG: transcriptional [Geobacteraceae bacterium]
MPTSPAKIAPPRLSEVFPRERLFHLLDQASARPLIWIAAPPGAGKTTLVSSYLRVRNLPSLWYQVDEGDGDIATFFYYLGMAAIKAAPRYRQPLPLFTPEYLHGASTFASRFFEKLFSRLKPPCAIVFDNYQEAPVDSPFQEVICQGLRVIPPGVSVIIISRGAPPASLARLKASRQMAILGWRELRLTMEETAGIVALQSRCDVPAGTVQRMQEMTQGWATGVVLMVESGNSGEARLNLAEKTDPAEVFDYFAGEILAKTDRETRDFLLKTSLLHDIVPRAAAELTGSGAVERILDRLDRNNYFTHRLAGPEPVYRYHPLFRAFLLSRANDAFGKAEIAALKRKAAALLEESGRIEDAAVLLRDTGDWKALAGLVLGNAQILMAQGRSKTLLEWLESIPMEIVEHTPWLLLWLAVSQLPFAPAESRELSERAFSLFDSSDDAAGLFLSWSAVVDTFLFEWNDFSRLDRWIDWLDERLRENPSFPSPEIAARVASGMAGALVLSRPHHSDIGTWAERAVSLTRQSPDMQLRMQALVNCFNYHLWKGDIARSGTVLREMGVVARFPDASPLAVITWKLTEALMCNWSEADSDTSRRLTAEALEIAGSSGVHVWDHFLFAQGVYAALTSGDTAAANEFLQMMGATRQSSRGFGFCLHNLLLAWYDLQTGNVLRAVVHGETALSSAVSAGGPSSEMLCRYVMAQVLHGAGEFNRAEEELALAAKAAGRMNSLSIQFMCLLASAQFALDRGDEAAGLEFLGRGMALGRRQRYVNMFWWWQAGVMTRLCLKALEVGIEVDYVCELVRKRNLTPDAPPVHVEGWPWPLKIYTLGRFEIVKDGKPVEFSGKVQQKPLAMLKALIALGGRKVSEERLSDLLWPNADGTTACTAFNTTLHRLRRLLGNDRVVQMSDGKITLNPRYCWVDAWAFQRVCREVEALRKEGATGKNPSDLIRLAEKALALYLAHFLAGDAECHWAISLRERLRSRFIHLVGRVGHYWEGTGKWLKAAECYQKGLETDDLTEEFYQRLMVCYQHMGKRAEALAVYNRCCTTLSAACGIPPSPKTRAIHKSITASQ